MPTKQNGRPKPAAAPQQAKTPDSTARRPIANRRRKHAEEEAKKLIGAMTPQEHTPKRTEKVIAISPPVMSLAERRQRLDNLYVQTVEVLILGKEIFDNYFASIQRELDRADEERQNAS